MKRFAFILLLLVLAFSFILGGCAKPAPEMTEEPKKEVPVEETPAVLQPEHGGMLRIITGPGSFPAILGYPPEIPSFHRHFTRYFTETLVDWDKDGNLTPQLAESWDHDLTNNTITWYLRKGVKFHDGTPFNAEAVKWNYQIMIDNKTLAQGDLVKSLEVIDEYTLRMHLTDSAWTQLSVFGREVPMFSPTAIESKGPDWAKTNPVGTGAFKLVDFQRDVLMKLERNNEYWQEGLPYLDGIEIRVIPDHVTAVTMLEAGQADKYIDITDVKTLIDLEKKGFKVNWGPGLIWGLMPFATDPNLPFYDQRVREAVEYALDRPAIANLMGFGTFEPLTQLSTSRSLWSYVSGFDPRPYNPEKAKQLLAEAGYPNGFETEIIITPAENELGQIIQRYLADVGIDVKLDIADAARRTAAQRTDGWKGLMIFRQAYFPDGSEFVTEYAGRKWPLGMTQSPEFKDLYQKAVAAFDPEERREAARQMAKKGSEDAIWIPIYRSSTIAAAMQEYVQSEYLNIHNITYFPNIWWMEKR